MIWWTEFKKYLLEAFTDRITLFAFCYCSDTDDWKGVEDYFKLFKYVSFAQTAFGLINNCARLNQPRIYLRSISTKSELKVFDVLRNVFLVTFTSGLFRIFITFWYSIMVYPIAGLRGGVNRFLVYWLALFCQTMGTFSLATCVSATTSNHNLQLIYASLAFMICILFSGGYYLESQVTWILRWIQYLSPSYYGRSALANNEYDNYEIDGQQWGDYVLTYKHAEGLGLWGSIGALMGLFVIYYFLTNIIFVFNLRHYIFSKK